MAGPVEWSRDQIQFIGKVEDVVEDIFELCRFECAIIVDVDLVAFHYGQDHVEGHLLGCNR